MRTAVLGGLAVVVLAALVGATMSGGRTAFGQQSVSNPTVALGQNWTTLSETVAQKYQQLTVVDSQREVIAVYHVDLATGAVVLKSVRNIRWDLRMSDFNGQPPLPREIQALSEQR